MPPEPKTAKLPPGEEWISVAPPKGVELPEDEPYPRVTREAFDDVYSTKGWTVVDGTATTSPATPESATRTTAAPAQKTSTDTVRG